MADHSRSSLANSHCVFWLLLDSVLPATTGKQIHLVQIAFTKDQSFQADYVLERAHGCQLPPELPKRWPLGVDRIKELWDSNADGRLLAFLCSIAKDYEPRNNLYQFLLIGPRAFHILHPKNVETLLSTNFKGQCAGKFDMMTV